MKKAIILLPICSLGFLAGCKQPEPVVEYTVKFKNWDGTVLQESKVEEGKRPVYEGQTPVHSSSVEDHEYVYIGWDKELEKVTADVTYTATFDYVFLFGSYPQTVITDAQLSQEIAEYGEHVSPLNYWKYQDKYYYKYKSDATYKADDGTKILIDYEYYYEVKPIKWRILGDENNKFYTTYNLIDAGIEYSQPSLENVDYPNNYGLSAIRNWLNDINGFFGRAFSSAEQEEIATTEVKNDLSSTKDILRFGQVAKYICPNTEDKVFCLSRQELRDPDLGFKDSDSIDYKRLALTTDFARAKAASTVNSYGMYWTRSPSQAPFAFTDDNVYDVLIDGFITFNSCDDVNRCVRPAIKLI